MIEFLTSKPRIAYIIILLIILFSGLSLTKIKRQAYPSVDFNQMDIVTVYPGASSEDVELNVTIKVEEALKEIEGIEKYTSRSVESQSSVSVFIDSDYDDKEKVKSEVRRAVNSISDFPVEVTDQPQVIELKVDNFPLYEIALYTPKIDNNSEKNINYHSRELKRRLLDLSSVSKVEVQGIRDREIQIKVNSEQMKQMFVSFEEVALAIKATKIRSSAGNIESYTSEKGIITLSEFDSIEDIENIIIRTNDSGQAIRIKDLAIVEDTFKKKNIINRYNGFIGISLNISKKSKVDILKNIKEIEDLISNYKNTVDLGTLKLMTVYDGSIETKNRLSTVYYNALCGFILVLIVLFLFLDKRIAFWTSVGIPLSIAISVIIMPFLGITINSISLCGLIVVLGMVVDDAIIISESIYRAKESGMNAIEAASMGLKRVIKPVIGTVATTIIAFLPIYFLPGIVGDFSLEIPTIVILMLGASLLESTSLLPSHLAHSLTNVNLKNSKKVIFGQSLLNWLEVKYIKLLSMMLKKKYICLLSIIITLLVGLMFSGSILKFIMFPDDQATSIWIYGTIANDSSLEFTEQKTKIIEDIINQLPEKTVYSYKTTIGIDFISHVQCSNCYYTLLTLTSVNDREMKARDVKKYILENVENNKAQYSIDSINCYIDGGGPLVGKPLEIRIIGNDNLKRKQIVENVIADLKSNYPVSEVDTDLKEGKKELRLFPKQNAISYTNLTVAEVASTIRTAFDGTIITYQQTAEENIPYRVIMDKDIQSFEHPLDGLFVKNVLGTFIPLKTLVSIEEQRGLSNVFHYNSYRTNMIIGNIDLEKMDAKTLYSKLVKKYENFEKENSGFKITFGGEAKESSENFIHIIISLLLAILTIYLFLVIQFNSFSQPLMIILAIPFGLIGVGIAFGIQGMTMSMMALLGVIGFSGVVVNDSIVMVDYINGLVNNSSEDLIPNIIEGAKTRLRPIILTSLTTIAGLLPTAYGLIGGLDYFVSPMVMAMAWGLFAGTISVLIIIPPFYLIGRDIKSIFSR